MRKPIVLLAAALTTAAATQVLAEDLIECVNPDVIPALMFRSQNDGYTAVTTDMPEVFADLSFPSGFEWIGSAINDTSTMIALKTELDMNAAFEQAQAIVSGEGWIVEPPPQASSGFSMANEPLSRSLCRGDERANLGLREVDGTRYINISTYSPLRAPPCSTEPVDPMTASMQERMLLQNYMPSLNVPQDATQPQGSGFSSGGGMSGGSGDMRTARDFVSTDTLGNLAEHFRSQLITQGWQIESDWAGTVSAGSTWFREGEGDMQLFATFELMARQGNAYNAGLRIVVLN